MLTSSALVLMMTAPGLALFYGGLVRSKNVLNLLVQSFVMIALISVQWVLWGYTLAFGPDISGVVGGLAHLGLRGRRRRARAPRAHHPAPALHGVPDDVRHHHAGAHHRRVRRAHEVQRVPGLLAALGHARLRPAGPHGVGRRAHRRDVGRARLRRRHGRPHQLGHLRAGLRARDRQAARLRLRSHAAAQPAVHASSAPRCCGSAGSASTPAARWRRTASPSRPSSRPTPRPRRRRSAGCSPSG